MPSLPTVGGSNNTWGTELNDWLAKGGMHYDVKHGYDATGDGVTDDTAAIQAAIDDAAAAGGGTIVLPEGDYLISASLDLAADGVSLKGMGGGARIKAASNIGALITINQSASLPGVAPVIENLRIRGGSDATNTNIGIQIRGGLRMIFRNLNFTWCEIGMDFYNPSSGSYNFCERNIVEQVLFDHCDTGIKFRADGAANSMAYNTFINVGFDLYGGTGLHIESTVSVGGSQFINLLAWLNDAADVGIRLAGGIDGTLWVGTIEGITAGAEGVVLDSTVTDQVTSRWLFEFQGPATPVTAAAAEEFYFDRGRRTYSNPGTGGARNYQEYYDRAADTQPVLKFMSHPSAQGGRIQFGAGGSTAPDGVLYWAATNTLKTDNKLVVGGEVELDGTINHDGSFVGFYGTAPVAKQTGVAVTAAGVHAALVALGLISA